MYSGHFFRGVGSVLPHTGQNLSSALTRGVSLHFGHLTGKTFTLFISGGLGKLVMGFFLPAILFFGKVIRFSKPVLSSSNSLYIRVSDSMVVGSIRT